MTSRILLIENNSTDAQVIEQLIQVREGVDLPDLTVTRVDNLKSGMERLAEQDFDAVLCDLDLPDAADLSGFFRVLESAGIAAIALADDPDKLDLVAGSGIADFLYKGSLENKLLRRSLMYAIERTRHAALQNTLSPRQFLPSQGGDEVENERRNRILLVTEQPEENQLGAQIGDLGYEVTVTLPAEAADRTRSSPPAIVVVDGQNGNDRAIELCQQLKKQKDLFTVPMIIATRNFNTEDILKAQASGVNSFIARPIRMGELALLLGMLARLQSREEQLLELTDQWQNARKALTGYFAGDFVTNLLGQKYATEIDGSLVAASVLSFALRDVQRLLDPENPRALAKLLDDVLGDAMDAAVQAGGSINRLDGDGFVATFGCPHPRQGDVDRACDAAAKIRDVMAAFNGVRSGDELDFGLSIASGEVFAAALGSDHRRGLVLLGAPVDRGAGLLTLALKSPRVNLLVDAETRAAAADPAAFKRVRAKAANAPEMYLLP